MRTSKAQWPFILQVYEGRENHIAILCYCAFTYTLLPKIFCRLAKFFILFSFSFIFCVIHEIKKFKKKKKWNNFKYNLWLSLQFCYENNIMSTPSKFSTRSTSPKDESGKQNKSYIQTGGILLDLPILFNFKLCYFCKFILSCIA